MLISGAFERLFCPEGREFEQANLQKFKCPGGGMLSFRIDRRIKLKVAYFGVADHKIVAVRRG